MPKPEPTPLALVTDWILAGMRPSQIPDHVRANLDQWPGGAEPDAATVLDLIGAAYEQIQADTKVDPARETAKAVARLNFLYAKCCAIQDYKGAAGIQKELNAVVNRITALRLMNGEPEACPPEGRSPPRRRSKS